MTKTRAEVITGALEHLGVASAEEPEQVADTTRTGKIFDAMWSELEQSQGLDIGDNSIIDDALFLPTYRLLASEIASYYGVSPEPRSRAVGRLRQAVLDTEIDTTVRVDYF